MPTRRQRRVSELIREELSRVLLTDLNDPRLGLVTVTHVEVTPDLRQARVYFSTLRSESQPEVLETLRHASKFIRRELAARIKLKFIPELEFYPDHAMERGMRIEELLTQVQTEETAEAEAASDLKNPGLEALEEDED
jgi:ribosome-binding factor A